MGPWLVQDATTYASILSIILRIMLAVFLLAGRVLRGRASGGVPVQGRGRAAAERRSRRVSILGLQRVTRACGRGAVCRELRLLAVTMAVAGLLTAGCTTGPGA